MRKRLLLPVKGAIVHVEIGKVLMVSRDKTIRLVLEEEVNHGGFLHWRFTCLQERVLLLTVVERVCYRHLEEVNWGDTLLVSHGEGLGFSSTTNAVALDLCQSICPVLLQRMLLYLTQLNVLSPDASIGASSILSHRICGNAGARLRRGGSKTAAEEGALVSCTS